ncbi:MAG: hypothetical protein IPH57_11880 [Saprospiraceae bacterium]|nr:hypothetical protein [Saprospiraceae bacterium]
MKIHSVSVLMAVPFIILAVIFGYQVLLKEQAANLPFLIISVVLLVAIYTLQPHIDFLWYKKYPGRLSPKDQIFLEKFSKFYNELNDEQKDKFEKRVYVFTRSKSFKLIVQETVDMPQDFKIAIASCAVQLTFNLEEYLFRNFDFYFAYQHPFPSPGIQVLHSVETNFEDRTAIFDIEMLVNSFNPHNKLFNTGLYAFSGIFEYLNKGLSLDLPDNSNFWEKVKEISGFEKEFIVLTTGYEPTSHFQILSTLFFTHNTEFRYMLPKQYELLCRIYNFELI